MKWIIILSLLVFSVACSKDMGELQTSGASLKCNISVGQSEGSGGGLKTDYMRGDAPSYVKGVILTAHNNEYSVADVEQTFNFGTTDPQEIVMTGLTVGSNAITAKGISEGVAKNDYYKTLSLTTGDLNEKANGYATQLRGLQPIYTNYISESSVDVDVSSSVVQDVNINMVTENHRVAVVLENPMNSGYVLEFELSRIVGGLEEVLVHKPANWVVGEGEQDAIVINDVNAKGDITYKIKVEYYSFTENYDGSVTRTSDPIEVSKTIDAVKSNNITKLFYFNKGELEVGTAIFSNMTWTDMTDDDDVITIN